jgi:hypothetical protein
LSKDIYITSGCVISGNKVHKNGQQVFEEPASALPDFLASAYKHFAFQYPKFYKMDNLGKLGWLANEVLLDGGLDKEKYKPEDVGIVLSNSNASLDTDTRYYETVKDIPSPALFVYTLPNIVIGEISIKHKFKGENAFFISDEFDPAFIEQYVSDLMNNNILQACICGWVEVLKGQYKAALYLVEKEKSGNSVTFTKENITKIYQIENG